MHNEVASVMRALGPPKWLESGRFWSPKSQQLMLTQMRRPDRAACKAAEYQPESTIGAIAKSLKTGSNPTGSAEKMLVKASIHGFAAPKSAQLIRDPLAITPKKSAPIRVLVFEMHQSTSPRNASEPFLVDVHIKACQVRSSPAHRAIGARGTCTGPGVDPCLSCGWSLGGPNLLGNPPYQSGSHER